MRPLFGHIGFAVLLFSSGAYAAPAFELSSPKLNPDGSMPRDYTCDGKGAALPLAWSDPPAGTRSLALVVDDPDAPKGRFVHWIVYDIPPGARALKQDELPNGAREGKNGAGKSGWTGPCPPSGMHHYVFTLYALDTTIPAKNASEDEVLRAMKGHVLGEAKMTTTYERGKR